MQFSLRSLLVFTAIAGVVLWGSLQWPVVRYKVDILQLQAQAMRLDPHAEPASIIKEMRPQRLPNVEEVGLRLAWAGPLTIVATLAVQWIVRRWKHHGHRLAHTATSPTT
jgi:hypothetical protein